MRQLLCRVGNGLDLGVHLGGVARAGEKSCLFMLAFPGLMRWADRILAWVMPGAFLACPGWHDVPWG